MAVANPTLEENRRRAKMVNFGPSWGSALDELPRWELRILATTYTIEDLIEPTLFVFSIRHRHDLITFPGLVSVVLANWPFVPTRDRSASLQIIQETLGLDPMVAGWLKDIPVLRPSQRARAPQCDEQLRRSLGAGLLLRQIEFENHWMYILNTLHAWLTTGIARKVETKEPPLLEVMDRGNLRREVGKRLSSILSRDAIWCAPDLQDPFGEGSDFLAKRRAFEALRYQPLLMVAEDLVSS